MRHGEENAERGWGGQTNGGGLPTMEEYVVRRMLLHEQRGDIPFEVTSAGGEVQEEI